MKLKQSSRRWFRFSLKTLLFAITAFGLWLGYYVNWMHQRRAAKAAPEVFAVNDAVIVGLVMGAKRILPPPNPFPWSFTILREKPVHAVGLRGSGENSENQRLADCYQKLFPESRIVFVFRGSGNQALADHYQKLLPECEIAFTDDIEAQMAADRAESETTTR